MFAARTVTDDREKLCKVGACVQIIPFPARQFRKFSGIVRVILWASLCAALCAHNCVRQCTLMIVCAAMYAHDCVCGKAKTTIKGWIQNNELMTELISQVGIELLGQLKSKQVGQTPRSWTAICWTTKSWPTEYWPTNVIFDRKSCCYLPR